MTSKLLVTTCALRPATMGSSCSGGGAVRHPSRSHPTHRPHKRGGVAIMLTSQKGRG